MVPDNPEGLKECPVIPVPLHVPPVVPVIKESRLMAGLFAQIGAGTVQAGFEAGFTVSNKVSEPGQERRTI